MTVKVVSASEDDSLPTSALQMTNTEVNVICKAEVGRRAGHSILLCNSTFPVFWCPQGISKLHSCPFFDVIFPSLLLSSSLLLAPFTVPCRIVFAMPEDLEIWPYHLSFRCCTMVRRHSCTRIAFWMLLRTSLFVTWSL